MVMVPYNIYMVYGRSNGNALMTMYTASRKICPKNKMFSDILEAEKRMDTALKYVAPVAVVQKKTSFVRRCVPLHCQ